MANTANTQEPTMEEILASIRRIISEDGEEAKPAAAPAPEPAKARPVPAPVKTAKAPPPVVVPAEAEEVEDVLELTEIVPEEEPPPPAKALPAEDDVVMVERTPMKSAPRAPVIAARARAPEAETETEEGLLSPEARNQASSSFLQLARSTLVTEHPDSRSLESLVQDMLRPMLEDWLNQNLPEIVDRLVQQEIDRVSRKPGR